MTDPTVSREPGRINLSLYAGDGAAIKFSLTDSNNNPFPLNGVVTSQIKAKRSDPAPLVSWTVDDSGFADGIVTLSLTGEQTEFLISGGKPFTGVWDAQYVADGAEPITFVHGKLRCIPDVTR